MQVYNSNILEHAIKRGGGGGGGGGIMLYFQFITNQLHPTAVQVF